MKTTITQRQLRNDSAAILRRAEAGERLTITRNGTPVAELGPVPARRFVSRAVLVADAATAPRINAQRFRADLDAVVDPDVTV